MTPGPRATGLHYKLNSGETTAATSQPNSESCAPELEKLRTPCCLCVRTTVVPSKEMSLSPPTSGKCRAWLVRYLYVADRTAVICPKCWRMNRNWVDQRLVLKTNGDILMMRSAEIQTALAGWTIHEGWIYAAGFCRILRWLSVDSGRSWPVLAGLFALASRASRPHQRTKPTTRLRCPVRVRLRRSPRPFVLGRSPLHNSPALDCRGSWTITIVAWWCSLQLERRLLASFISWLALYCRRSNLFGACRYGRR